MKINPSILLAAACSVAAVLWVGSGQLAGKQPDGSAARAEKAAAAKGEPRSVRVIRSAAAPREEIVRVLGHTEAKRKVELRVETAGRVVELPVERGRRVEEGQVIARLATDDRKARYDESLAMLKQRRIEHEGATKLAERGFKGEMSVADAAAKLDAAKAMVTRMEVELQHTVLKAPFGGVLDARAVEIGSYLKAGDPVATIVDLSPLRVTAWVAERDAPRLAEGLAGTAVLADGTSLEGRLAYVGRVADPTTRTFKVELEAANPEGRVAEGLTAELRLPLGRAPAHRLTAALLTLADDGAVGVKTVEPDGRVRFRPVAILGEEQGALWVGGLPEDVTLISVGQEFVRDGQLVRAVTAVAGKT